MEIPLRPIMIGCIRPVGCLDGVFLSFFSPANGWLTRAKQLTARTLLSFAYPPPGVRVLAKTALAPMKPAMILA